MFLLLSTDFIMITCAMIFMYLEVRHHMRLLTLRNVVRNESDRFTETMRILFDLREPFHIIDFLEDKICEIDEYVLSICTQYFPELAEHHRKYLWVLLVRRRLVSEPSVMDLTRVCHQSLMCMVNQLRIYGEIKNVDPVRNFRSSFSQFVACHAMHVLAQRTWAVAAELRGIARSLDESDPNLAELQGRFENCLRDVRTLIE